ncbi:1-phosphatidylinositol 4,5-bisphosphate phosphodiesterase delta-4 [Fusarium oxysporum f. sp. cubense]|uniref:Phosphoinositide phospholipase C n=1 Tax=Fusarium oxysporum f. sp. cubense TaxID=61366 RepID=A0A559L8W4_FUSOC|nr:1-phosphatidylinositol 4,5-bisphosphate phosphodiesterase delta-4 [Fusarium oxysporum f. sp. cubense]
MTSEFNNQPRHPKQEELDMAGVKHTNFRLSDIRRRKKLNFTEFKGFIRLIKQRRDIQRINCSITAKPEIGITFAEFLVFLRDMQGEDLNSNLSMWEKQFAYLSRRYRPDAVETSDTADDMLFMSEAAFVRYLTSKTNSAIIPEPQNYTFDRPMDEYIISSSHNTYLLGRQVAGQSSVKGYISALIRGYRCVENDCWDGNSGQPEVNHGHSLTTSISFREVIATINNDSDVRPQQDAFELKQDDEETDIMVPVINPIAPDYSQDRPSSATDS